MTNLATLAYCALYAVLGMVVVVGLSVVALAVITVLRTPADLNDVDSDEPVDEDDWSLRPRGRG